MSAQFQAPIVLRVEGRPQIGLSPREVHEFGHLIRHITRMAEFLSARQTG